MPLMGAIWHGDERMFDCLVAGGAVVEPLFAPVEGVCWMDGLKDYEEDPDDPYSVGGSDRVERLRRLAVLTREAQAIAGACAPLARARSAGPRRL